MKGPTALLLLALCGTALANAKQEYHLLETLEPAYDYLNVTGWGDYPSSCWLFSTPALSLVATDGLPYMIQYNVDDAQAVANAWCQLQGFDSATDLGPSELPTPYNFNRNSINVATGATSSTGTGFKYIECARGTAAKGCSAALPNKSGSGNRGYMNDGSNNFGNYNTGSNNYGDWNTGSNNYGSFNQGSSNKGSYNKASNCVGDECTVPNQVVAVPGGGLPSPLV
eukprot:scaffold9.g3211.t1